MNTRETRLVACCIRKIWLQQLVEDQGSLEQGQDRRWANELPRPGRHALPPIRQPQRAGAERGGGNRLISALYKYDIEDDRRLDRIVAAARHQRRLELKEFLLESSVREFAADRSAARGRAPS